MALQPALKAFSRRLQKVAKRVSCTGKLQTHFSGALCGIERPFGEGIQMTRSAKSDSIYQSGVGSRVDASRLRSGRAALCPRGEFPWLRWTTWTMSGC